MIQAKYLLSVVLILLLTEGWVSAQTFTSHRVERSGVNWAIGKNTLAQNFLYFSTLGGSEIPSVASPYDDADIYRWDGVGFAREIDAQDDLSLSFAAKVDGLDDSTDDGLCLSFSTTTTLPGLGDVQNIDVACEQDGVWSLYFDGSAHGLTNSSTYNLNAISLNAGVLYFTTGGPATIPGVAGPYGDVDIYSWDGVSFARVFDGSGVGLANNSRIDGLEYVDSDTFYLSFGRDDSYGGTVLPDGTVAYDEDVVIYDAGNWSVHFDGTEQGFDSALNGQDIDALDIISTIVPTSETAFSTLGGSEIPGVGSPYDDADIYRWDGVNFARDIDAQDDLSLSFAAKVDGLDDSTDDGLCLSFSTTTTTLPGLGDVQNIDVACEQDGVWSLYFDGSAHGLTNSSTYNLNAISLNAGVLYFTTGGPATIPGVAGPYGDVDIYSWGGVSFARVFDGSSVGLANNSRIDGLKYVDSDTFYLSFGRDDSYGGTVLPDGTVAYDEDVVLYEVGSWSIHFDGTEQGFDPALNGQDINALDIITQNNNSNTAPHRCSGNLRV